MSIDPHIALALRKERLLVRVGEQREQLAQYGERLRKPCAAIDKVIAAGRYMQAHPWAVGVAMAVAVVLGRRQVFRWAGYALSAWRAWGFVGAWARQNGLINPFKNK